MPIRAILFDLDETLMRESGSDRIAGLATCEFAAARVGVEPGALHGALLLRSSEMWRAGPAFEYCRAIGISPAEGLWGTFGGLGDDLAALRSWVPSYRRDAWARALDDVGIADAALALELAEMFARERHARHVVYPDALDALETLVQKYPLAIVTNGASEIQREKIARCGLERFFRRVLISAEVGVGKPDRGIFDLALAALAVQARATVMVGDNLSRDVRGAKSAGLATIWVNRSSGLQPDVANQPDAEVSDLVDLDRIVHRLGMRR
ncbi:MAG: HAD family hydrolase [Candidatus Binataceae bacterium]